MLVRSGPSDGDVSRDRHATSGRNAMDAASVRRVRPPDETLAAYGEVVWSWRRDPGVYPVRLVAGLATVTIKAAHRGEHEANRQTLCGESRCDWLNSWWTYWWALFFLPPGCGCGLRPAFPAPSLRKRDNECRARANHAARIPTAVVARLDRATQYSRDACV